jgi:hypothetical protein
MIRDDFLLRMIRKAAEAIARALGKADETPDEQTEAEILEALGEIAKLPVATLLMLDQDSLAALLHGGDVETSRVFARGLTGLARIDEGRAHDVAAKGKRACAIALYRRVGIGDDPLDRDAVRWLTNPTRPT